MKSRTGFAVVTDDRTERLCCTDEKMTGATVFQVYKTKWEAQDFCDMLFRNIGSGGYYLKYKVKKVKIEEV